MNCLFYIHPCFIKDDNYYYYYYYYYIHKLFLVKKVYRYMNSLDVQSIFFLRNVMSMAVLVFVTDGNKKKMSTCERFYMFLDLNY